MSMTLFCKAPWAHYHVKEKGDMMPCCFFKDESSNDSSFEDYWNSEYLRNYRLMFLRGEVPTTGCSKCISTNFSRAKTIENRTSYTEEEIRQNTTIDGYTTLMPHSIDIRVDLCNLKCITCHYYSSSRWATHDKVERTLLGVFGQDVTDDILKSVQYAEWAGGEPFMSPVHFNALQRMIDLGRASEVTLAYTTNGTFPGKSFTNTMSLLKQFKQVLFSVSIDALGDVGEFIRDGWKASDLDVFSKIKNSLPNVQLLMGITVTNIGLYHLVDTIDYCLENSITPMIHPVSTFRDNSFLDLNLVPKGDFVRIINELKGKKISSIDSMLDIMLENHHEREWSDDDQSSWLRRGKGSQHPEVFEPIKSKLVDKGSKS